MSHHTSEFSDSLEEKRRWTKTSEVKLTTNEKESVAESQSLFWDQKLPIRDYMTMKSLWNLRIGQLEHKWNQEY